MQPPNVNKVRQSVLIFPFNVTQPPNVDKVSQSILTFHLFVTQPTNVIKASKSVLTFPIHVTQPPKANLAICRVLNLDTPQCSTVLLGNTDPMYFPAKVLQEPNFKLYVPVWPP